MEHIYTSSDIAEVWGRVFRLLEAELSEVEADNETAIDLEAGRVSPIMPALIQRLDTASRNLARFSKMASDEAAEETPAEDASDDNKPEGSKLAQLRLVG